MAASHWRNQEADSYSVQEAGGPQLSQLSLKAWKIPGELPVFSSYPKPENPDSWKGIIKQKQKQQQQIR